MSTVTIGLDIAKAKVDVCLRLPSGKYRSKVISNDRPGFEQLLAWLARHAGAQAHACMEATGAYWEPLAEHLSDAGLVVSVINPAQIKAFAGALGVRSKTDALDARVIADFCAAQPPQAWQPAAPAVRVLRALVARRQALVQLHTQEVTRLQVAHESVHASIQAVIDTLRQQINSIQGQIEQHIDDDPALKSQRQLLQSVPGLGDATIPVLLGHLGGPARFSKTKQAVAFAGLDVRQHHSGASVRGRSRLSKRGNSQLRQALYMPALVSMRLTPWGRSFAQRLSLAGKPKMVILGALMRKLLVIAYAVLRSGRPFDASLHGA